MKALECSKACSLPVRARIKSSNYLPTCTQISLTWRWQFETINKTSKRKKVIPGTNVIQMTGFWMFLCRLDTFPGETLRAML
jgi:hypothetical protein